MTKLSVNINKIATIRNARGGNVPDLLKAAVDIQEYGAELLNSGGVFNTGGAILLAIGESFVPDDSMGAATQLVGIFVGGIGKGMSVAAKATISGASGTISNLVFPFRYSWTGTMRKL